MIWAALIAALLLAMAPGGARAETLALLVGVSDYADPDIPDLRGPRNDVRLMRDVLRGAGVGRITLLATGVEGADGAPTRAAILDRLAALAKGAAPGDLVYIHLSGHGSRQGDLNGDETDGLDEIFLPMDVHRAPNGASTVPGALTDDEIGQAVARIRARGADVFLVMDSCHSGSGLRAVSGMLAERQVSPRALGLDLSSAAGAQVARVAQPAPAPDQSGWGRYLAFYATRSNDVAREVDMSLGKAGDDSEWYGLFTAALAARMAERGAESYRQLFQSVLGDLNKSGRFGVAAVQTPLWEGTMIDAPVLGRPAGPRTVRYLLRRDKLDAGQVNGLQKGTLMALVANPADPPDAVIGYAQVISVTPRSAVLRPVAASCEPRKAALCPVSGSLPAEARLAQVEQGPLDDAITFSPVLHFRGAPVQGGGQEVLNARLDTALKRAAALSGLAARRDREAYRVQVLAADGKLWFGPEAQVGGQPVGAAFDLTHSDDELVALLVRILRAERLAASLEGIGGGTGGSGLGGGSLLNPAPVTVTAQVFASDAASLTPPGAPIDPLAECRAALSGLSAAGFQPLPPSSDLKQCDMLRFSAEGNRNGQRDVNRIHVDAQYCIHVDYEMIEGTSAPRPLGEPMVLCSDCTGPTPYSAGDERLYVLISALKQNREALNLTGLIENCGAPETGAGGTRSAAGARLGQVLGQIRAGGATRGSLGLGGALTEVWVKSYRWRILPRPVALRAAGEIAAAGH